MFVYIEESHTVFATPVDISAQGLQDMLLSEVPVGIEEGTS